MTEIYSRYNNQTAQYFAFLKITRLTIAWTLFLLSSVQLSAQWRSPLLTKLSSEEGLPMVVNAITDDFIGYKYFGGSLGLVRYDGDEFELMSRDPDDSSTIGPGEVYNVVVGQDSILWIGLRFAGLNSYDPTTRKFKRYPVPKLAYTTTPTAHGLCDDGSRFIWVGGHHFQLLKFDKQTETYTSYQPDWVDPEAHSGRLSIINILQDRFDENLLWLTVLDYSSPGVKFRGRATVTFNKTTHEFTLHPNSGFVKAQTPDGLLISSNITDSISTYNPKTGAIELYDASVSPARTFFTRGLLWTLEKTWVTNRYSLLEYDKDWNKTIVFELDDPLGHELKSISLDSSGNLWFGNSQGVLILEKARQHIKYFSLSGFNDVSRIYPGRVTYSPQSNTVYLSTLSRTSRNRVYRIPLDPSVKADFIKTEGSVTGLAHVGDLTFAAMNGGLHILNRDGTLQSYNKDGFDTYEVPWTWNLRTNPDGWVAGVGLDKFFWFKPNEQSVRAVSFKEDVKFDSKVGETEFVGFKFMRSADKVLVYNSKLYTVDLTAGSVTELHYPREFNPDLISLADVEEDRSGYIWMSGPRYIGKYRISNDSLVLVDKFIARDGLTAASEAHELFLDHLDRMWLYTVTGITVIDISTREVRTFGVENGLENIYIDPRQVIATPDGNIVTVNSNGIITYNPDNLWNSVSPEAVSTVIKDVRINGIPIEFDKDPNIVQDLAIAPFKGVIDISFQGLGFPEARHINYCYRLSQSDEWIDIGQNKLVTLPTLAPGIYDFQVKASRSMGNAPIRSLQITVGTPFYQQIWFILLVLALISLLEIWIYRLRINAIRKAEKEKSETMQKIAELELKALRSQMNPHFMFNSLNSIKNYILQAEPKIAAEYLSNFSHLIRMILQNSGAKLITLKDELETLMLYVDLEKLRFDDEFEFNCIIDEKISLQSVMIPPMIMQPYIENAIWHGLMHKDGIGQLTIEIKLNDDQVHCIIEDNGVGRAAAARLKDKSIRKYRSMGMGITKDRIDIINRMDAFGITTHIDDLKDDNGDPSGTRVIVVIPANIEESIT